MAEAYTRTIEFKAKDNQIRSAVNKLGKSLVSIDKSVDKINKQFTSLTTTVKQLGKVLAQSKKQEIISPKKVSASIVGIKRINKLLKEVKVQSGSAFGVDRRKSDEYNVAATQLQTFVREVANGTKTLAANEAGLKRQAAAFSLIAQNSKVASAVYQTAVFAQVKAEQKLRLAQMERIRQQEKLFQLTGLSKNQDMAGFKGAEDMLAMESQISNTVASLTAYKSELQSINSFLDMSSKEYIQIEKAIDRINDRLNSRKNIEKNNLEILKEAEKVLGRTRKTVGGILNRGMGELFGVLGGKRGPVPQLVAGDLGLESIKQMLRFVPLLDKKLKAQIRVWLNYGQVATRALTGVQVGFGILSKTLAATTWVGEAIRGFIQFEAAASKVIWSIEGNMTKAFSLFGRLARELPQLASAVAMTMPKVMGGMGLGGSPFGFMADGSASGQVADALMGGRERRESKRVTQEGPSRIQALQKELDFQQKLLINRNTSAKDYNRIRRATLVLEKEIANELAVRAGQSPLAEQLEASREFQRFKEETLKAVEFEKKEVKKVLDIETRKNKLFKSSAQHHKRIVNINGENLDIEQRILRVQQRRKALESRRANRKAARGRLGENLMLGAGFPLLFGGGVGSVGGGVLGAGAQAMMGGQGFGAQILLSALGQQMDEFVGKIATLGKAFNVLNPDVDAVISSLGETNTAYGKHLEMLKEIKGEGAAMTEATRAVERIIGKKGLGKIKEFGQDATDLGNEWQKVVLRMQSSIADLISSSGILKAITQSLAKGTNFQKANLAVITGTASPELQELWDAYEKQNTRMGALENTFQNAILRPLNEDGSFKFPSQAELRPMIADQFVKDQKNITSTTNLLGKGADKIADLEAQRQKLEDIFKFGEKEAAIREKINNKVKDGITLSDEAYRKKLEEINALNEINEIWKGIATSIEDGVVNAINSAIDGTKTLGEVASSVFRQISQQLLKYGVNAGLSALPGIGHIFQTRATGGPVKGGSPYIVGEKGPELFVPGSSGNIVPNHAMGGSNVVVNVDATGSSVAGDAGQAEQLGSILAAAVQTEIVNQQRPGGLLAGTR